MGVAGAQDTGRAQLAGIKDLLVFTEWEASAEGLKCFVPEAFLGSVPHTGYCAEHKGKYAKSGPCLLEAPECPRESQREYESFARWSHYLPDLASPSFLLAELQPSGLLPTQGLCAGGSLPPQIPACWAPHHHHPDLLHSLLKCRCFREACADYTI